MKLSLLQQIARLEQRIQTLTALGKKTTGLRKKLAKLLRRLGPRAVASGIAAPVVMLVSLALYYGTGGTGSTSSGGAASTTAAPSSSSSSGSIFDPSSGTDATDDPMDATALDDLAAATGSSASGSSSYSGGGSSASSQGSGGTSSGGSGGASAGGSLGGFVLVVQDDPAPSDLADDTTASNSTSPSSGSSAPSTATGSAGTLPTFAALVSGPVVRVEEDWELRITTPDPDLASPQVGTVITPLGDANDFYLAFALNHRFNPAYEPGGMELQLWWQGQQLGWVSIYQDVFNTPNETVTWTQQLEIQGNSLRFSVVNGQSATWGSFGQGNSLHLNVQTTLTDLSYYSPAVSAANSGVTFASNRVQSLVLKAVRGYSASGELLAEDPEPVVVFSPAP